MPLAPSVPLTSTRNGLADVPAPDTPLNETGVNAVYTPMLEVALQNPDFRRNLDKIPMGRTAEPEEIAAAVVYLASEQAEWASGAVLDLNGASYLR